MEWLVWMAILATVVVGQVRTAKKFKRLEIQLQVLRTRQGKIVTQRVSRGNPQVDARARTIVRDTKDIPTRGARMGQAVRRNRRNLGNREDS